MSARCATKSWIQSLLWWPRHWRLSSRRLPEPFPQRELHRPSAVSDRSRWLEASSPVRSFPCPHSPSSLAEGSPRSIQGQNEQFLKTCDPALGSFRAERPNPRSRRSARRRCGGKRAERRPGNLIKELQEGGHGRVAQSWVGTGPNQDIAPQHLADALGSDTLDALSQHTGMGRADLIAGLSQHLPDLIDQLTPNGRLPSEEEAHRMV